MTSGSKPSQPPHGVSLAFEPEYAAYSSRDSATLTFGAHLVAPCMEEDDQRAVVSLSAVLDKSGSMSGNKIGLVRRTCGFMMQQLSKSDKLGVVSYDSDVEELLKLARTSEAFKREAKTIVDNMQTGTCTNLSGGLFQGIRQQQQNVYIDYDAPGSDGPDGPGGGEHSSQPSADGPPSPTSTDFTDAGSDISNFSLIEAAVPLEEEDQQMDNAPVQQLQMPVMPVRVQAQQQVQQQRRGIMQRMTQLFRGGNRSRGHKGSKAGDGRLGEVESLLKDGKSPKGLELEADAVRSVFLFTDGLANEGITEANKLVDMLQRMLDKSPRVRVYTFGYGADHSPDLLQRIAAAGSGTYYFIENEESIPTAFADALGGLLSVAAQNVTVEFSDVTRASSQNVMVEFEAAPGVSVSQVYSSFKTTSSGGSSTIAVGDLFSEESKDILFDVQLPALSAPEVEYTVGTLRISYLDVAGACVRSDEVRCTVARPDALPLGLEASSHVMMQKARITTAQALQEAKKEADAGRYEEARRRVQTSLTEMQGVQLRAKGDKKNEALSLNLVDDLSEALSNMQDQNVYASKGSKIMCSKAAGHFSQRTSALEAESQWATEGDEQEAFTYANKSQMQMRRKAKAFFL